jgi:hypothetical protein
MLRSVVALGWPRTTFWRVNTERLEVVSLQDIVVYTPMYVRLFGHAAGGRAAERLTGPWHASGPHHNPAEYKAKRRSHGDPAIVRVVGIDDWAWKKGTNYGTVIADLASAMMHDKIGTACSDPRRPSSAVTLHSIAVPIRQRAPDGSRAAGPCRPPGCGLSPPSYA